MLTLFTVLNKEGEFEFWKERLHSFATYFVKKDIDDTIKIMLQYYSTTQDVGFYKINIQAEKEFVRLKWLEAYSLYMYKWNQITLFFMFDSPIQESSLKYLCYRINRLEVNYETTWQTFDSLMENKVETIQKQLEETKEKLVQNITMLLDRGERIEELLEKSKELNKSSIQFKKNAKKLNSCC